MIPITTQYAEQPDCRHINLNNRPTALRVPSIIAEITRIAYCGRASLLRQWHQIASWAPCQSGLTPTGVTPSLLSLKMCPRKPWGRTKPPSYMYESSSALRRFSCPLQINACQNKCVLTQSCYVRARDGVKLAVDVMLPRDNAGNAPVPCVLFQARYFVFKHVLLLKCLL